MDINEAIRSYAGQPLTHQLMISLLKEYKRPNDKIHALLRDGILEYIKKGLYITGLSLNANRPEPFLLANHIMGPSYVSLEAALSYHGFIPERVYEVTSVTPKTSRKFQTPVGIFSYTHLSLPYYSFGVVRTKFSQEQYALIASPEKALCDKVVTTPGLLVRSKKTILKYLLEDLRIDEANLKELNTKVIAEWLPDAYKRESLSIVIKAVNDL